MRRPARAAGDNLPRVYQPAGPGPGARASSSNPSTPRGVPELVGLYRAPQRTVRAPRLRAARPGSNHGPCSPCALPAPRRARPGAADSIARCTPSTECAAPLLLRRPTPPPPHTARRPRPAGGKRRKHTAHLAARPAAGPGAPRVALHGGLARRRARLAARRAGAAKPPVRPQLVLRLGCAAGSARYGSRGGRRVARAAERGGGLSTQTALLLYCSLSLSPYLFSPARPRTPEPRSRAPRHTHPPPPRLTCPAAGAPAGGAPHAGARG